MIAFALSRPLTFGCFLLLPSISYAHGCRIETASAPLHAAVGGGQGCSQKVEVKVCAPTGKVPKASSIKDIKISPNVDVESEAKNVDGGCVEAKVTVRSRTVMGPPIWEFCQEGSYEGRLELAYCH